MDLFSGLPDLAMPEPAEQLALAQAAYREADERALAATRDELGLPPEGPPDADAAAAAGSK